MNRRQKIIVSVTGIFLVLLLLVGLTYAYFLTRITGNTNDKSISVSTANLAIVYGNDDGSVIGSGEKITPGTTFEPKTFTVTNNGNANTDYVVVIEDASVTYAETIEVDGETQTKDTPTTFESNDFTYTLTCESGCNSVQEPTTFPIEGGILVGNRLDVGETQTYTLTLTYNETGENQSNDMNKKLEAKINIKDITTINPYSDKPNTLAYNIINNAVALTNEEKSLGYAELVGAPYTKVGEELSEISNGTGYETSSLGIMKCDTNCQERYWTYGTGYIIDENTGEFSLTGVSTCKYNDETCNEQLIGQYVVSPIATGNHNNTDVAKSTINLSNVYKIISAPESSSSYINITYKAISNMPESVISTTQDEYGTSYYYRGAVKNNYLEFNRMCWRIVRIEGDGSVKITLAAQKSCNEITENDIDTAFIGSGDYGYTETEDLQYFANYESSSTSSMKYKFNIFLNGGSFESYDADNNLETQTYIGFDEESLELLKKEQVCIGDTQNGYTIDEVLLTETEKQELYINSENYFYKNYLRLYKNNIVSLMCDLYGNKTSETKIFPLTADEVVLAGSKPGNVNNTYYLRENASRGWLTLSIAVFDSGFVDTAFYIDKDGAVGDFGYVTDNKVDLRPAVSLIPGITVITGDGTINNPYIVG